MKFGLHLHDTLSLDPDAVISNWQEMVSAADTQGFEYVSVSDHLVPFPNLKARNTPLFDPWQLLAAYACQTQQVTLLTLASNASIHHPTSVAKRAVTLDRLSHGRMMLGLGAGGYTPDEAAVGQLRTSQTERYARLGECIDTVQKLWTGEEVSVESQFVSLLGYTSAPAPVHSPRILIAGKSQAILSLAATRGSACNFAFADPEQTQALVSRLERLLSNAQRSLKDFEVTLLDRVFIADSDASAKRAWQGAGSPVVHDGHPGLIGGPETLIHRLSQLEQAGANTVFCMFQDVASLRHFSEEVMTRIH